MTGRRARAVALLAPVILAAASGSLTPQQQRGRRIYRNGESLSGKPITASLGEDSTDVPAGVVESARLQAREGYAYIRP